MHKLLPLIIVIFFVAGACDSSGPGLSPATIILRTDFGDHTNPNFIGWDGTTYDSSATFVKDFMEGYVLSLEAGPEWQQQGAVWYDFDSLEPGIYILTARTRVLSGLIDTPIGRMTFDAQGQTVHSEVSCGMDPLWHMIETRDTLKEVSSAAIHLFGGNAPSEARVQFSEVQLLRLQ